MNEASIQFGIQQANITNFRDAQGVIDRLMHANNAIFNNVFCEHFVDGNGSIVDLDSMHTNHIEVDELQIARIFPHKHKNRIIQIDTKKIEKQCKILAERFAEIVKIFGNLFVIFLVRLDYFIERMIVKGNEYIQITRKSLLNKKLLLDVKTVQPAKIEEYIPMPKTTMYTDIEISNTVSNTQNEFNEVNGTMYQENTSIFLEVLSIVYAEIRYGKNRKNIDSV